MARYVTCLVSIDPGVSAKNALGFGVYFNRELVGAGIVRPEKHESLYSIAHRSHHKILMHVSRVTTVVDEVAVEWMQLYGALGKGNSEDLIRLTAVGSLVAGMFLPLLVTYVPVSSWKGSMPEDATTTHVRKRLSPNELLIAESNFAIDAPRAPAIWHNGWAGIGIGLNRLGRMGR